MAMCRSMNRYDLVKQLGDGSYGSVALVKNKETGEMLAVKKMKKKYFSWDECISLREIKVGVMKLRSFSP